MSEEPRIAAIIATPGVCGGRPRLSGTRIDLKSLVLYLNTYDSVQEILEDFPYLTPDDIMLVGMIQGAILNV